MRLSLLTFVLCVNGVSTASDHEQFDAAAVDASFAGAYRSNSSIRTVDIVRK